MTAPSINLTQLETELDAFLADYQRLPPIGASEHQHARKQRFLDRMKAFALQAASGQIGAAAQQPAESAMSTRGRPPKNSDSDVIRAALQLESEGKRVTGSKLRALLGGGRVDRYAAIWSEYVNRRALTQAEPSDHPVAEVIARQRLENDSAEETPRIVPLDSRLAVGTKLYSARPALPN